MGVVEDIVGAVIVMMMVVISMLVYLSNLSSESVDKYTGARQVFLADKYGNDLNALFSVTEQHSSKPMGLLLADAVYFRNSTPTINNETVYILEEMKNLLDAAYGKGKYYLVAKPRIVEVSLNFVIDGSITLGAERQSLAASLPSLIDTLEQKIRKTGNERVVANIFSLKANHCSVFNRSDSRINCRVLTAQDLYSFSEGSNLSSYQSSAATLEHFKNVYNLTPPMGVEWASNPSNNQDVQTQSDWATGTAYASYVNNDVDPAKFVFIFPVSDQLSSSSVSTKCFERAQYCDYTVCSLCDNGCPAARSLLTVERAIRAAADYRTIINPVYSFNCDYKSVYYFGQETYATATKDSGWNSCDINIYTRQWGQDPAPTWCTTQCTGCTDTGSDICFHPSCQNSILEQMTLMATSTGGVVTNLQDIENIDLNVQSIIEQDIEHYTLKIGHELNLSRNVVELTLPTPSNRFVDVRLWVYTGVSSRYDDSPPSISIISPANNAVLQQAVNITVSVEDDEGINRVAFLLNGSPIGTATAPPYSFEFDLLGSANGTYNITAVASDTNGQPAEASVIVSVSNLPAILKSIVISQGNVTVEALQTAQFSAQAYDQYGRVFPAAFAWSVSGGGIIDGSGLFTADIESGGPFALRATASGVAAEVNISVRKRLVVWLRMEGDFTDSSGEGNSGIPQGAINCTASGRVGKSCYFDGTNALTIPDKSYFSPSRNSITILVWVRIPFEASKVGNGQCGSRGAYFVAKGSGGRWEWALENDNNLAFCTDFWTLGGSKHWDLFSGRDMNDYQWHHYAVAYDYLNKGTVYIDGSLQATVVSFSSTMGDGTSPVYIGRRGDGYYFTGYIDELRIYNDTLSAKEIKYIYTKDKWG